MSDVLVSHNQRMWVAGLLIWLSTSLVAGFVATSMPLFAVSLAAAGGVAFGWVGARRVDAHRVKVRARRRRRHRSQEAR